MFRQKQTRKANVRLDDYFRSCLREYVELYVNDQYKNVNEIWQRHWATGIYEGLLLISCNTIGQSNALRAAAPTNK